MRHKEWKMGTMVERIQPVGPSNLLNNMVEVFASTGNTLPPGNLRTFCVLQVPVLANWLHLHHPCILGGSQQREQNQNSKPTPGVTMMHHATKRGFKDCPGFLNSTGRLGPKRGRKCYITPAFSGVPNKGNKIKTQNLRRGSP